MTKAADAFRTISEVADDLEIPKHVLRFWEVKFAQIRPMKRGGGRRYYRPEDLELLKAIRVLLHRDGYTIKGVQKILREQGVEAVKARLTSTPSAAAQPISASLEKASGAVDVAPKGSTTKRRQPRDAAGPTLPLNAAAIVAAAIAELEKCRALLGGDTAQPAPPTRMAGETR